jgi:hypothetical protein
MLREWVCDLYPRLAFYVSKQRLDLLLLAYLASSSAFQGHVKDQVSVRGDFKTISNPIFPQ